MKGFRFNEKYLSQIPALQQLIHLDFEYLSPEQALATRQGKAGNVLLEGILRDQLKTINRIHHKRGGNTSSARRTYRLLSRSLRT